MYTIPIEEKVKNDTDFIIIVNNILKNKEFAKMKKIKQHGTTRYLHSLRVAYFSYKISKKLKLDYISTARAALLHDFYEDCPNGQGLKNRLNLCVSKHPHIASKNSKRIFGINALEENIIKSHMFPFGKTIPKHKESIIVDFVDDVIAIAEFGKKYRNAISYTLGLMTLIIKNTLL